jgi:hypothetical protein
MSGQGEPGADARKGSGAAGLGSSGLVTAPALRPLPLQAIDGMTIRLVQGVADTGLSGAWWVWESPAGQEHANPVESRRCFVAGRIYVQVNGKWEREAAT